MIQIQEFFKNAINIKDQFKIETIATLYMVFWTALIAGAIGLILGIILTVTGKGKILESLWLNSILDKIVNIGRSIPFVIMIAIIAPLSRFIVSTSIGNKAAIVPLVFGTFPFFARQVETALADVDKGVIEAAQSIGLSPFEIIRKVYIPEGLPALIRVATLTVISLIGLPAMSGAVGAGGLGKLAINVGYNRFQPDVTLVSTGLILIIVFIVQFIGNILARKVTH